MVELSASLRTVANIASDEQAAAAPLSVEVSEADASALRAYRDFCKSAIFTAPQNPVWVESWLANIQTEGMVVTVRNGPRPVLMLALEIVSRGPIRLARFMGGSHANGNFAAFAPDAGLPQDALCRVIAAIHEARPDIDLVVLERMSPSHAGNDNPLRPLATGTSPNLALAADLSGGFEALLTRKNGAKKRKKYRHQLRLYEAEGGHELIYADTRDQAEGLLAEFFDMKAQRFAKKGIPNVFAEADIQAFFRDLFVNALKEPTPPFILNAIKAQGEIKAVDGLSMDAHCVICQFGTIREDSNQYAPGFLLEYLSIERACAEGKTIFDFSVGDEAYKRSWSEIETWQFDCMRPLTLKGRAYMKVSALRGRAVRFIKSNDRAWRLAKAIRARLTR